MTEVTQNQLAQLEQTVSVEQIQLSEKLGAIKATAFFKKLVTVTEIKLLAEIKESKQYKGLKLVNSVGKLVTVTTFEEFCQHLGMSREKVDQDILNLSTFGEDFLETSQRMGLGYRDLRKLRKLPDSDREVLINGEAVKTEDRESLIDLIEEMSAKHAQEKATRDARIAELESNDQANALILKKKDEKINQLDTKLTKLESPAAIKKRDESEHQQLAASAIKELHDACQVMLNATARFRNQVNSVIEAIDTHGLYDIQQSLESNVIAAFQQIAQTSTEFGIQINFEEMVTPEWLMAIAEDQQATALEVDTQTEQ
ncbi:hypothetical protein F889_02579 [Acinetobacter colistiniresistens]|uniref:DUF3102 domain-containing protein n=1 Tax=Acinetobacter colistiniresistens TaxID=280145 RepID=N9R5M0_9GAMM|nr:hypothetical protein [Acinetobacter colistiniresistens]ENX33915.1 hypothetical protein F889_02579 [Acinetobacter colistiniresistens]